MAKKHNKISGQFSARLIEMMESPAFRVLTVSAPRPFAHRDRVGAPRRPGQWAVARHVR
jgi:hypothetical protein